MIETRGKLQVLDGEEEEEVECLFGSIEAFPLLRFKLDRQMQVSSAVLHARGHGRCRCNGS